MSKRVVILGAGESGTGAALLAKAKGFEVFVSDMGAITDNYKAILTKEAIPFEEGKHTEELILNAAEVIKSPGIPDKAPLIKKLKDQKIPVISEIEFAARYTKATLIGITGTNGKTTTTLLTYHLLKKGGLNVGLAGNIGESFAKQVIEDKFEAYVLELSSFQLDGMFETKLDIGVLTNITPDHLDRYDYKIEKYVASKFRIMQNMDAKSTFIYGMDSDLIEDNVFDYDTDAEELPFSIYPDEYDGACGDEEGVTIQINSVETYIDFTNAVLKGKHNMYNMMAAILIALKMGVKKEVIDEGLADFENASHRMESVGVLNGVTFVNDSKATNIDSAFYALDAYSQPIVWIAGGTDKGNNYADLNKVVQGKVKALVCMTKDADKLKNAFKGMIPEIKVSESVTETVKLAYEMAKEGDVVLLSPACASFDLFKNYEDRGDQFREAVKDLIKSNTK